MYTRFWGPYAPFFWGLLIVNVGIPQLLWIPQVRLRPVALWLVAMVINFGMWLERFVIVIVSLHRDFLAKSWGMYYPTRWDYATLFGSIGLFLTGIFLFIRLLPMISISEMRELVAPHGVARASEEAAAQ
jgi:molybdopterin-containing oxidoreductase family membrane subunit